MLITDIVDKLIMFHSKYNKSYKEMAKELDISDVYMSRVIQKKVTISDSLHSRIEQLFKRYGFHEALDNFGRL